ncbi:hypothetical protein AB0D10_01330 [Kitasatospora sp. NPDC048545]|uniref:hypothetical protein n=1 Tax=Kitasatospora sp. NPDC048545 TaxID=3157208 RepID=UPI0033FE74BC
MTTRDTYTGPTTYRTPAGTFRGPHVTNAPVLAVEPLDLTAIVSNHDPLVRLTLANPTGRGPRHVETAEWGTPDMWKATGPKPTNEITAALTTAGLSAHLHQNRHGDHGAIVHLARKGRYCQLVIINRSTLFYQLLDQTGHEPAYYPWENTRPADAPTHVRRFCRLFNARILPTRPANAVPGQPLNP